MLMVCTRSHESVDIVAVGAVPLHVWQYAMMIMLSVLIDLRSVISECKSLSVLVGLRSPTEHDIHTGAAETVWLAWLNAQTSMAQPYQSKCCRAESLTYVYVRIRYVPCACAPDIPPPNILYVHVISSKLTRRRAAHLKNY